jgi:hypothetical protein
MVIGPFTHDECRKLRAMQTNTIASLKPIRQLDGTTIRLEQSGKSLLLYVRIGQRETSRPVDVTTAQRFWMGIKGALPVVEMVQAMKDELLNARESARLAFVSHNGT